MKLKKLLFVDAKKVIFINYKNIYKGYGTAAALYIHVKNKH